MRVRGLITVGGRYPTTDDDDSPSIDRRAKHTLSRAVQFDTQIKDLDVSLDAAVAILVQNFFFFQSKLREHLGNFRAIESSIKGALAELNVRTRHCTR